MEHSNDPQFHLSRFDFVFSFFDFGSIHSTIASSTSMSALVLPFLLLIVSTSAPHLVLSDEADVLALLSLKSTIDTFNSLHWQRTNASNVCSWQGVKSCLNGRVSKLVLENLNLSGELDEEVLKSLDQLRVLSFKRNSIRGQIPNLSSLRNLKSLFLDFNNFSGGFPESISELHRLKVVSLSYNNLDGEIPHSLLNLRRLYALYLQNNQFSGEIPPLNQSTLRHFNVSNNRLSGQIPITAALVRFNLSSFSGNENLCGEQIGRKCRPSFPPESSPVPQPRRRSSSHSSNRSRLIKIIAGCVCGGIVLLLILALLLFFACRKRTTRTKTTAVDKSIEEQPPQQQQQHHQSASGTDKTGPSSTAATGSGFSWEKEGIGRLIFCGPGAEQMSYSLEDLLKASAETLGRGTMGSTYKAVMETGFIVTVKRLKDARFPRTDEFRAHVEAIGRLRHQNLVPLRAYFQAKEERLLVYDYFPNGSLFSLIHGSKTTSGGGKPLHWTSCLKIAEDLATGLLYIHQNGGLTHGNLKSSNVLLRTDFESCLTDYGLSIFQNPDSHEETSATALFYRAPECRDIRRPPTQQADVYSFGVLLLELLTGKTPFQELVQEHIPQWVKTVREEEAESGDEPTSGNEGSSEEKLAALLNIAMSCVSLSPESRPGMREVVKMIRDTRGEAQNSSNSSDHSPGRWSDTVQSLPREEQLSI